MTADINAAASRHPAAIKFILFRIFFNARYYYPVFTILFLDFGLSLEQFALLNAVWAAVIMLAEVPSGALADIIGRKHLVTLSSLLMVAEIAVLCWVPVGNPTLVFYAFLINRILSGLGEAAASGADEALAYDALKENKLEEAWPAVLAKLMKLQSIGFFFAMITGAFVYAPGFVNKLCGTLGFSTAFTQIETLKWPLWLTLAHAIITLFAALSMHDVRHTKISMSATAIRESFRKVFEAAAWIWKTPFALIVISTGFVFDSVIRMFVTLSSEYYRIIDLPIASFGFIGAAMALIGMPMSKIGHVLSSRPPIAIVSLLSFMSLVGLCGAALAIPYFGLIFAVILFAMMPLMGFFLSHFLNQASSSEMRATVLSFKGLALNLGYGILGIAYGILTNRLRGDRPYDTESNEAVFIEALKWFPGTLLVLLLMLFFFSRAKRKVI